MLAGVIGTIETAFFCFDDGVDAIRVRARNGDADLSENSIRPGVAS